MRKNPIALCAILLSLSACDSSNTEFTPSPSPSPPPPEKNTCFWIGPYDKNASLLPDEFANYWSAQFTIPAGKKVFLQAQYPHARYISYVSYNDAGSGIDIINDQHINPAQDGSVNPFIENNQRNTKIRNYSIELKEGLKPTSGAEPNTLYANRDDGKMIVFYRIYAADDKTDILGGVGFPELVVENEDKTTVTGQEACDILQPAQDILVGPPPSEEVYPKLLAAAPPQDPAVWQVNRLVMYRTLMKNALFGNPDNKYLEATLSRNLGEVAVLRGKLPTTPKTFKGDPIMGTGNMRYWSICSYEFYTQKFSGCVYDENLQTDSDNNYVIAASREQDKPVNAIDKCGYNWIKLSDAGDGADRLDDGMLMMRNMLPNASFTQAIQNIPNIMDPQQAVTTMGDYLPSVTYMSKSDFEAQGCKKN